jgi:hypothetical protein
MKPMNFPGRKNERRKRALARMSPPGSGLSLYERSMHLYEITRQRILPDGIARAIRTKKDRSDNAKLHR